MSATEQLLERVKLLDEAQAKTVLGMLEKLPVKAPKRKSAKAKPSGIYAMLGYAKKYNHPYKTTAEWMSVLREGEKD
ncbi:MAG: hypothetical protein EBS05_07170 [Proteobacteria bacterium]|jgi:hypothetical protein|nr:hypothetical protein [Pseudomonadota bacterium]